MGQGRENAKSYLASNPEIMMEISDRVRKEAGIGDDVEAEAEGFTEADEVPIDIES